MALTLAAGPLRRFQLKAPSNLPLLISLRDHAESIAGAAWSGDYDLVHALQAALIAAQGPDLPATWFERLLGRGTFLVLLDGLDEVADFVLREQVVATKRLLAVLDRTGDTVQVLAVRWLKEE